MKRIALMLLVAALGLSACSSADPAPARPSAAPGPTFADLSRGSTTSVVKLYSYNAAAQSAVVEPIVFLDGPEFCRRFRIKATDGRCELEYTTEDSHIKITVPVIREPKLLAWDDGNPGHNCTGDMTSGGLCPVSAPVFGRWAKDNPAGFAVVTTIDGTVTKIAQMYTP